jgi:hypothetical protein
LVFDDLDAASGNLLSGVFAVRPFLTAQSYEEYWRCLTNVSIGVSFDGTFLGLKPGRSDLDLSAQDLGQFSTSVSFGVPFGVPFDSPNGTEQPRAEPRA